MILEIQFNFHIFIILCFFLHLKNSYNNLNRFKYQRNARASDIIRQEADMVCTTWLGFKTIDPGEKLYNCRWADYFSDMKLRRKLHPNPLSAMVNLLEYRAM